jgi:hypothetical protein
MSDIFIVGPARSGTSWLQTMLAEHPDVASPPETGLFVEFIGPMERAWQRHRAQLEMALAEGASMNVQGMATVVTGDDIVDWFRVLYDISRRRLLDGKPGATRLLEKTPDHAMFLDLIWKVAPDAQVIVLVRDPRSTVRSMLQASGEAWGHWAAQTVEGATDRWLRNVEGPLERRSDPRLILVRYEDLRANEAELRRVATILGLGDPSDWLKTPLDASPRERQAQIVIAGEASNHKLSTYDLDGFSFHDRTAQRELSRYERVYVETRCREQMRALGYDTDANVMPVGFRLERAARLAMLRARHYWRRYQKSRRRRS